MSSDSGQVTHVAGEADDDRSQEERKRDRQMIELLNELRIAPTAAHRLRFHQRERAWVVESASRLTIAGLVLLTLALTGGVLLITDLMFDGARVWIYTGAVCAAIVSLWFLRPLARHAQGKSSGP